MLITLWTTHYIWETDTYISPQSPMTRKQSFLEGKKVSRETPPIQDSIQPLQTITAPAACFLCAECASCLKSFVSKKEIITSHDIKTKKRAAAPSAQQLLYSHSLRHHSPQSSRITSSTVSIFSAR